MAHGGGACRPAFLGADRHPPGLTRGPLSRLPMMKIAVVGATGPTGIHVEGAKAMSEYEANIRAVREKTARLRALRLAKEASANDAHLTQNNFSK